MASGGEENPIPRLDSCCFCLELKLGVLILCILQMIGAGIMLALIGVYILWGIASEVEETVPMLGGGFTLFALLVVMMLTAAEFGFALFAFSDIRKAEPVGIRYYYMFKLVSLGLSLFIFMLTSYWTLPEVLNLFLSSTISLYSIWCIWSLHEALMLGGEAAKKAGFTEEELAESSRLISKKKAAAAKDDSIAGSSQYV